MKKNVKGITLVALVVTIIVLLILAGVAINFTIGNNGIFKRAKEAAKEHEIATIKEEIQMKVLDKELEKTTTGGKLTQTDIEEILNEYGTINKNEDGTIKELEIVDKEYKIAYEEIYNGEISGSGTGTGESTSGDNVTISKEQYQNIMERLDALDGGTKSTMTLSNVNDKIDNTDKKVPIFHNVNIHKGFTSSTNFNYTGVNVTIPKNSYFSLTVAAIHANGAPKLIAIGNYSTWESSDKYFTSSDYSGKTVETHINNFTNEELTLYVFAQYEAVAQNFIWIEGYYVTFPDE